MSPKPKPGIKHDEGKLAYDLLPFDAVDEIAGVMSYGCEKYGPGGWRRVQKHRYFAAAMRHLSAAQRGLEYDDESGLRHLAHAAANLLFLLSDSHEEQCYERPNE